MTMMEIIKYVFLSNVENIKDFEFKRLINIEALRFYNLYIERFFHTELKNKIEFFKEYFHKTKNEVFYIGDSFGEIESPSNPGKKVFVYIKDKTEEELLNLAIIKTKLEDDFISFKLGKAIKMLYDLELIDEKAYNKFLYGTDDVNELALIKVGLSSSVINFIKNNNLYNDINIKNGSVEVSSNFKKILDNQDDFIKFEVGKIIF